MTVEFESLKLIPQMYELLNRLNNCISNNSKRWLSVKELSLYLTFGKDKIYKMIDVQFLQGEHYYKKENRLIFDKQKIDEWVLNTPSNKDNFVDTKLLINNVLSSLSNK
ncbi:MAG: helix-turn-helix domain-containing protein [Sulfurimonas sp.]|uniref:helix-turn-helix domain-containing protein n=1 Tax=Sulfurimonas sp. TaxID=2022749 RepID=UPI00261FF2D5|nr:helix-turn-helix domain-containing protein [Sulfurimonas sp.]MDD5373534.1 helix-turn-helix domain-containing protein [Sulfurimonas sp.]